MVIYFLSRTGYVLESIDTRTSGENLYLSPIVSDDSQKDSVSTGVKSINLTIKCNRKFKDSVASGKHILVSEGNDQEQSGYLYSIVEWSYEELEQTMTIYGEDASMVLLNSTTESYPPADYSQVELGKAFNDTLNSLGNNHGWDIDYINVTSDIQLPASEISFSSEDTVLARLQGLASAYGVEMYFRYGINGMKLESKTVVLIGSIGYQNTDVKTFRLGTEISRIEESFDGSDIFNTMKVYGVDADGNKKPLSSLKGYSAYSNQTIDPNATSEFDFTRKYTYTISGDKVTAGEKKIEQASFFNTNGEVMRVAETEYDNAKDAIAYAMSMIDASVDGGKTYSIEFVGVPDVKLGQMIVIANGTADEFISSRIIETDYSEINHTLSVSLGDTYVLKGSKAKIKPAKVPTYDWTIYADEKDGTNASLDPGFHAWSGILEKQLTPLTDISQVTDFTKFQWIYSPRFGEREETILKEFNIKGFTIGTNGTEGLTGLAGNGSILYNISAGSESNVNYITSVFSPKPYAILKHRNGSSDITARSTPVSLLDRGYGGLLWGRRGFFIYEKTNNGPYSFNMVAIEETNPSRVIELNVEDAFIKVSGVVRVKHTLTNRNYAHTRLYLLLSDRTNKVFEAKYTSSVYTYIHNTSSETTIPFSFPPFKVERINGDLPLLDLQISSNSENDELTVPNVQDPTQYGSDQYILLEYL